MIAELFHKFKKWWPLIVAVAIAGSLLFYKYAQLNLQSYKAYVMIEYLGLKAKSGYNPDGSVIDTSEIYLSSIVLRALKELNMSDSVDYIRHSIQVEPLISDEEYNIHDAKVELGEEYELVATRYLVTLTVDNSRGEDYAYLVLNQILDEYVEYYAEKYVNTSNLVNSLNDESINSYDYIELTEMIDDNLDTTLQSLDSKIGYDDLFRLTSTGYSFSDLYREFLVLRNSRTLKLMAEILCYRVTKNRDILMLKYTVRNENLNIANVGNETAIEDVLNIIDEYVSKMQALGNTDITSEYILGEVYDQELYSNKNVDQTTEYDILLNNYVKARTNYLNNVIDYAYNEYIMNTFMQGEPCGDESIISAIESEIVDLIDEMNRLLSIANETNVEFNNYLGAKNIRILLNVYVTQSLPVKQFTVIVFTLSLILLFILFVMIIRIKNIVKQSLEVYRSENSDETSSDVENTLEKKGKINKEQNKPSLDFEIILNGVETVRKLINDEGFNDIDILQ